MSQTRQNENAGEYKIFGVQSNVTYISKKIQATLNYSYTYPKKTRDSSGVINVAVADIAANKINAILNYEFLNNYDINFRENYVSSKKAGIGTSVDANPIEFFGYSLTSITLSAHNFFKLPGVTIHFICNNIFNKNYYSPGIVAAGGFNYPGSILQMGRNFSFRINYEL